MERGDVEFALPDGRQWARLIDTQSWFDRPGSFGDDVDGWFADNPTADPYFSHNIFMDAPNVVEGTSYGVVGSSIVVLEEVR